jgi:hypothetical protein
LKETAEWPSEIDEIFYMPDVNKVWNRTHLLNSVAFLARTHHIERIVPLDDFDLELAAYLREHLRVSGLGESETRLFRDKLAMRMQARESGLPIPDFTPVIHHGRLNEWTSRVPTPWVLKPRLLAGAMGIRKVHSSEELWGYLDQFGDQQSFYLLERFLPGDIYHVDSMVCDGEIRFAQASKYGRPPLEVSHGGGIFTTRLLERGSAEEGMLLDLNARVLQSFGMRRGVSHTEYIRAHEDGQFYFLETSARVGGAHIADLVEAATGVNLWRKWARLEVCEGTVEAQRTKQDYGGLLVSLARQEWPDLSVFDAPEVVWRMRRKHHVGLIVTSPSLGRVEQLLEEYTDRVARDFHAVAPPRDTPPD